MTGLNLTNLLLVYLRILFKVVMKVLVNSVRLIGNMGFDPDVRVFENGKKMVKFNLATTEKIKDEGGEYQDNTTWHRIVAWGKLGNRIEKTATKGTRVLVEGKLNNRYYIAADGQRKFYSEVVISDFLILKGKKNLEIQDLNEHNVSF